MSKLRLYVCQTGKKSVFGNSHKWCFRSTHQQGWVSRLYVKSSSFLCFFFFFFFDFFLLFLFWAHFLFCWLLKKNFVFCFFGGSLHLNYNTMKCNLFQDNCRLFDSCEKKIILPAMIHMQQNYRACILSKGLRSLKFYRLVSTLYFILSDQFKWHWHNFRVTVVSENRNMKYRCCSSQ